MDRIRTIVCDDEPNALEGVLSLLRADPQIAVVGQAGTGFEVATLIEDTRPELVFLDIQMPELDAFGALARIPASIDPVVIFVTAHDEHALRAFEAHALDYLLKPFSNERFAEALERGKRQVRQRRASRLAQQLAALVEDGRDGVASVPATDHPTPAGEHPGRIMVRTAKQVVFVRVKDVDWIEADDYYAKLHVAGRSYLIRETMQSLEKRLDPRRFARVHRSAIVNLDRIQTLQPYIRGAHLLTMRDGTRVTLSRSRRASFEHSLGCRL